MRSGTVRGVIVAVLGTFIAIAGVGGQAARGDAPAPSWWNGTCDVNHYAGSHPLGASFLGVQACGPGPMQGGTDHAVSFFPGAWGEYEWECVELSMRFMYLVYGIAPYAANGKDVVANYGGTRLTKVTNNGTALPAAGDVLSMSGTPAIPNGHTAVVTGVSVDAGGNGTVTTMEENAASSGVGTISVTGFVLGANVSGWLHDPNSSPPPTVKADFNRDGRSDVASFYNYDGGAANLSVWNGQSGTTTAGPHAPWSATGGWDASRLIPAGTGDFNGDHYPDTAAFYRYDNQALGLDIWYGDGQGGLAYVQSWYVGSAWDGARVVAAGAGDFDGDGRTDIAAFYRYDDPMVNLYIWHGQANGTMSWPSTVWTGNGWDGARIIPIGVGDTDGDGRADISTFYRHDNGMMDQNVWFGDGTGNLTLGRPWHVDSGWDGARFIAGGVADLDGDHRADTIAWYRHDNLQVDMRIWYGTASRVGATDPGGPWTGTAGWDGLRMMPAGTGDYNGDGRADVACFYRYDGQVVGLDIWYGDGTGALTLAQPWYDDSNGWEGNRMIPAARG